MRLSLVLCCCLPTWASSARSQTPLIPQGTRVQVTIQASTANLEGVFVRQHRDSIIVAAPDERLIPWSSITRIRVRDERNHGQGAKRGMVAGGLIGGGAMLVIMGGAYLISDEPNKSPALIPVFVAAGALNGILLGGIIGGIVGAEKWTTVYPAPIRFGAIRTMSGATGVALSVAF